MILALGQAVCSPGLWLSSFEAPTVLWETEQVASPSVSHSLANSPGAVTRER